MNRELQARLHRAGPWICAGAVLILVAVCPWLFRGGSGDGWLWRWLGFGVLVLAVVVAYAVIASGRDPEGPQEPQDRDEPKEPTDRESNDKTYAGEQADPSAAPSEVSPTPLIAPKPLTLSSIQAREPSTVSAPSAPSSAGSDVVPEPVPAASAASASASEPLTPASLRLDRPDADDVLQSELVEQYKREADATQVALLALGRKVQSSAHRIQQEAARAVAKHNTDPDVLETGLRLDHAAAQQARLAQSLATLCGMQPGQRWHDPMPVSDVVLAAAGRITAYKRVKVEGDPALAVVGTVVEPLIHMIAELLANATQCSPPGTQVHVTLNEVRRGAAIEIDDSGVSMDEATLQRARETASGHRVVTLADLGEVPQTGLAVVGTYARRHGFRVDLTESVHGGIRAAVIVPKALTVPAPKDSFPDFEPPQAKVSAPPKEPVRRPASTPEPRTPTPTPAPPAEQTPTKPAEPAASEPTLTPQGLPKRRSHRTEEPAEAKAETEQAPQSAEALLTNEGLPKRQSRREGRAPEATPTTPRSTSASSRTRRPSAEQAGAWMGSYLAATRRTTKRAPETPQAPSTTGEAHDED